MAELAVAILTTGTLDAISTAVMLRPPTLAFPVSSLTTLEPLRRAEADERRKSNAEGYRLFEELRARNPP